MSYDDPDHDRRRYHDAPYDEMPYDGVDDDLADVPDGTEPIDDLDFGAEASPERERARFGGRGQPDAEELLRRVTDVVRAARPMPLSASVMINKEEVLDLLEEAVERLPDELREARWLRKERDEYLAKMRADGDEIIAAARARAERMVQRTEVVKAAEQRARHIVEAARAEARRRRLECEDFIDKKLAGFEVVLERTMKVVSGGRDKLQATNLPRPGPEPEPAPADDTFFDQDRDDRDRVDQDRVDQDRVDQDGLDPERDGR